MERRFGLVPDGAEDGAVLAEMQLFVGRYDPAIRLRAVTRDDQMARIYPVSWRTARIAVFRPLPGLWRRDREAAQAVLLREVAHRRHGDQLVVGPGSPLVWLMRIWVPAFVVLALAPVVVYAALGGGLLTQAVAGQGAWQLLQPVGLLILPVAALWLAELDADLDAARVLGAEPVRRALQATGGSPAARAAFPAAAAAAAAERRDAADGQLRAAGGLAGRAGRPAPGDHRRGRGRLPADQPVAADTGRDLLAGTHQFLRGNQVLVIAAIIVLLLWPLLARPWDRLWSGGPGPDGRQPWRPYLAAAVVPVALLALSLAPCRPVTPGTVPRRLSCSRLLAWRSGPGFGDKVQTETTLNRLLSARTAADAQNAFGALMAATAGGLRHPPPDAARGGYITALTDFRTAGLGPAGQPGQRRLHRDGERHHRRPGGHRDPDQPAGTVPPLTQPGDREDARGPAADQTPGARPDPARRHRLRDRAGHAERARGA